MCYHFQQLKSPKELEKRFNSKIIESENIEPLVYNGFTHPDTPIITDKENKTIQTYQWGLIPNWVQNVNDFRKKTNTLNAKIETVEKLPSYRNSINNRCLIIASSFFEWKWIDAKGKQKVKHQISVPDDELFAMAGLYSIYKEKSSGIIYKTYTILTTEANELMAEIHNSKKRMPVVLKKDEEKLWLEGEKLDYYHQRKEVELVAQPLDDMPLGLF